MINPMKILIVLSLIVFTFCLSHQDTHAQTAPNTITFDNQSGEFAIVKLIGPTKVAVEVPNGQEQTVHVEAGEYYILGRYGTRPEEYTYTKGDPFTVTQSGRQYSVITITLHKVVEGNYHAEPVSGEAFENAELAKTGKQPNTSPSNELSSQQDSKGEILPHNVESSGNEAPNHKKEIIGEDGAPMVLVPAGEFMMGSREDDRAANDDEKPAHPVTLDSFYIDKYEVTTPRYMGFIKATGRGGFKYWNYVLRWIHPEKPVVSVTWNDAQAYCDHYDKRLPTEAEWEKAARGTDERFYPWGNDSPTARHANFDSNNTRSLMSYGDFDDYEVLSAVGSREAGVSPYGVQDMAGNVLEWVADWYDENYYQNSQNANPKGANGGKFRVIRGGSWINDAWDLRATLRKGYRPSDKTTSLGFRCAKDVF